MLQHVTLFSARRRFVVLALSLILAAASLFAASTRLGVTTDTAGMFAASLPWKQRSDQLARLFPQNDGLIVAVINAAIPEEAEATAEALEQALAPDHTHFKSVTRPDALPYLAQNALLLVGEHDLEAILNRTVDSQPFLGQLAADPSLRGLLSALNLVVQGAARGVHSDALTPALAKFHASLSAALSGHPEPLSWETLLAGKLAEQAGQYRFVLIRPNLDFSALQPGGEATDIVRATAARLPYVQAKAAKLRLTGSVVLDDEEFGTVAEGAAWGLIGSFLLVTLWLYLAVGAWRVVLPILATLVLGLTLTTGFAAMAIGTLNLISVAFAVLFLGIAVDFAIQFCVRLREAQHSLRDFEAALALTGRRAGIQILVAALATAAGFLAFTPTNFVGVAQLGTIAGAGMLIAFACTHTFLPALLTLTGLGQSKREVGSPLGRKLDRLLTRHARPVTAWFAALAIAGAFAATTIGFDGDPLHTKDQTTEAVTTLYDLMADPITNPYTIEALLPSPQAARAAAAKLAQLPGTQDVLSLDSFIPADQPKKLAALADAAGILDLTLSPAAIAPAPSPEALRSAARALADAVNALTPATSSEALRQIGADASALAQAPTPVLMATGEALTRFLPAQLARLRTALHANAVSERDLPPDLLAAWRLPDGRSRIQALPKRSATHGETFAAWVNAAQAAIPQAAGSAIFIRNAAQTITGAFQTAAYGALAAIALILTVALRRAVEVLLVMVPLLISALLTALCLRGIGMELNFANIIALPLLLGVGVSFNIYFVMNWRSGGTAMLGSATARAVLFSALTTSTAFGSLALSHHPGTASMGVLLLLSLGCTVVTTLTFLPALLSLLPRARVFQQGRHKAEAL